MFDKLDFILQKYEELSLKVSDPDIINNQPLWQKYIKEMGEMEPIVNKYKEYKKAKESLEKEAADLEKTIDKAGETAVKAEKADLSEKEKSSEA